MLSLSYSISYKLFQTLSTFVEWLVRRQSGLETTHHYLNDFILLEGLTLTFPNKMLVDTFHSLCTDMRVSLNKDEAQGPTTSLVFMGLFIDTTQVQIGIPQPTYQKTWSILKHHTQRRTITINSLQCIVGKLIIIAWDIPESRAYKRVFIYRR